MKDIRNERLLIISNNVLSNTRNNGKTIYSYIDSLDSDQVAQLYFNGEYPSVGGYKYFRITDKDIIKGVLSPKKRGCAINDARESAAPEGVTSSRHRGDVMRLAREVIWQGKWKSKKLIEWLDEVSPTAIFFVGGDCLFAYDICKFIAKRYNARTSLYITDDYIMPRTKDSLVGKLRKKKIKKRIEKCLEYAESFFTVSDMMRREYKDLFGKDSSVIVNLSEPLKMQVEDKDDSAYTMMYAGSLYYGRDEMLGKLSAAVKEYNDTHVKKALLKVYTNMPPDEKTRSRFIVDGASEYCGSLDKDGLRLELNRSDILVFVESFDKDLMEKTKYSLSTKVPEYLSVGKPVLAIGPMGIGSIDYLSDVAVCVDDLSEIKEKLTGLLDSEAVQADVAEKCEKKYLNNHSKEKIQKEFLRKVLGTDDRC